MDKIIFLFFLSFSFVFSQISTNEAEELKRINRSNDLLIADLLEGEKIEPTELETITLNPLGSSEETSFFGYGYFLKEINFFDNVPTPSNYKLGPGDEIVLSIWGQHTAQKRFILNNNGSFFYENLGYISLLNKTLDQAKIIIENEFSKIYETINDSSNPTQVMLELGNLKSINIFVSGETKSPGINLIHPFSDIFVALSQVGIKNSGSLRNVELIRDGKLIAKFDFYEFFINGKNNFSNVRLIDGDVVHIPVVKNRIEVQGEVVRPQFYEILSNDSLTELINYAGGLSSLASNKAVLNNISPQNKRLSDDNSKYGRIINISSSNQEIQFNNGASINFLPIADNRRDVEIFGRVTLPGSYPAFTLSSTNENKQILKENSLRDILDLAGGFDDPLFRKTIVDDIVILRLSEDSFYSKKIIVNYSDAENFLLKVGDKIFVYEYTNYENSFSYSINGEINMPGTYPLIDGLTLSEAISEAGGVTDKGSINRILVYKSLTRIDAKGNATTSTEPVGNISLDFKIDDQNVITILPKTNVIRVSGNVYKPGLIANSGKSISMSKAIELAGGYKPYSLKKRVYVIRANGEVDKANFLRGKAKRVFSGDSIFVPVDSNPDDFEISSFISELASTLANIAAILILVDNNNN